MTLMVGKMSNLVKYIIFYLDKHITKSLLAETENTTPLFLGDTERKRRNSLAIALNIFEVNM